MKFDEIWVFALKASSFMLLLRSVSLYKTTHVAKAQAQRASPHSKSDQRDSPASHCKFPETCWTVQQSLPKTSEVASLFCEAYHLEPPPYKTLSDGSWRQKGLSTCSNFWCWTVFNIGLSHVGLKNNVQSIWLFATKQQSPCSKTRILSESSWQFGFLVL